MYDAVIVGAGPAGLSAALVLGRCRRRVLVCDTDLPRNAVSRALHGFLSRDGINPHELRRIGREQLLAYEGIEYRREEVVDAERGENHFRVTLRTGETVTSRLLLLATGVVDVLPQIEGVRELYGTSVFHCPYCDGWEMRDQPLAAFGGGDTGGEYALELLSWSRDVVLCTGGEGEISGKIRDRLLRQKIQVREEPVVRLEGREGVLERIIFSGGASIERRALFFHPSQYQHSALAEKLGCHPTEGGVIPAGSLQGTEVPGLYLAGDAARSVQLAIVAAAEGAQAAFAMNTALQQADLETS